MAACIWDGIMLNWKINGRKVEQIMKKGFEIINISAGEKGILKTVGNREVVLSVKLLPGSGGSDNDWLIEALRAVYMQYYSRVAEYRDVEGS